MAEAPFTEAPSITVEKGIGTIYLVMVNLQLIIPCKSNFRIFSAPLRGGKSIFSKHFGRVVDKIRKNLVGIVVPLLKLRRQRIKIVGMRAKTVW